MDVAKGPRNTADVDPWSATMAPASGYGVLQRALSMGRREASGSGGIEAIRKQLGVLYQIINSYGACKEAVLFLQTLIAFGAEAVLESGGSPSVAREAIEALCTACDTIPDAVITADGKYLEAFRGEGLRLLGRFANAVGAPAYLRAAIHAHAARAYAKAGHFSDSSYHYLRAGAPAEHGKCLSSWSKTLPASERGMLWAKAALQYAARGNLRDATALLASPSAPSSDPSAAAAGPKPAAGAASGGAGTGWTASSSSSSSSSAAVAGSSPLAMARGLLKVLEYDAPDVFREVAGAFRPLARDPDVSIVRGCSKEREIGWVLSPARTACQRVPLPHITVAALTRSTFETPSLL